MSSIFAVNYIILYTETTSIPLAILHIYLDDLRHLFWTEENDSIDFQFTLSTNEKAMRADLHWSWGHSNEEWSLLPSFLGSYILKYQLEFKTATRSDQGQASADCSTLFHAAADAHSKET